jgi:hypothetical protein
LLSGNAGAQSWVPARGEGSVSLTFQNYDVAGHFDALGRKNTNGGTQSQAVVTEFDYGVTDTIGIGGEPSVHRVQIHGAAGVFRRRA